MQSRSLFGSGFFHSTPGLGLTFNDLRATWNQYAPTVRTDLKAVRDEIYPKSQPAMTPYPASAPVYSPTNLVPGQALQQKSSLPIILAVLAVLGAAGGGYYLYKRGYFKTKK